jgi:hypothetical protein
MDHESSYAEDSDKAVGGKIAERLNFLEFSTGAMSS